MNQQDFVHLHVHSDYSLIDGAAKASSPDKNAKTLAKAAKKAGQVALALTDHGTLSGSISHWKSCDKEGIKPIIGIEGYLAPGDDALAHTRRGEELDGTVRTNEKGRKISHDYNHVTLLAKNLTGWQNLSKLSSIAWLEGYYYRPRMSWDLIRRHKEGLIVLSGCLSGQLSEEIRKGDYAKAEFYARRWKELLGDDFYLEVMPARVQDQGKVNDGNLQLARRLGIKVVASSDVHYIDVEDAAVQEVKICVNNHKTISENRKSGLNMEPEFYFKSSEEMQKEFSHVPEAVLATREIAEKCEKIKILPGKFYLPKFLTPDGTPSVDYFKRLCHEGLVRRFGVKGAEERKGRLEYEIGVIEKSGFIDYFLIVQDLVNWGRMNNVPPGPGRGSAAGSLASYCLGITNIDPLRYDLIFERFMNPERVSMPDIDMDFCLAGGTEVMDPDSGEVVTLRAAHESQRSLSVHAIGEDFKQRRRRTGGVVSKGRKPVLELVTSNGRSVVATPNHRFLTDKGWIRLKDMKPGDMVATARKLPAKPSTGLERHELLMLAGLVSEGGTTEPSTLTLTQKTDDSAGVKLMNEYERSAKTFDDTFAKRYVDRNGVCKLTLSSGPDWRDIKAARLPDLAGRSVLISVGTTLKEAARLLVLETLDACKGNKKFAAKILGTSHAGIYARINKDDQIKARRHELRCGAFVWAEDMGLVGCKAHEKKLPPVALGLPDDQVALLIGRLWTGDGSLYNGSCPTPCYTTTSEVLAKQLRTLLLRIGIVTGVYKHKPKPKNHRIQYTVNVIGEKSVKEFCDLVFPSVINPRDRAAEFMRRMRRRLDADRSNGPAMSDPVPMKLCRHLIEDGLKANGWRKADLSREAGVTEARFTFMNGHGPRTRFSRKTITALGRALGAFGLALVNLGESDVFWDKVISVKPHGIEDTYDIVDVDVDHNFALANGIFAHNCELGRGRVIEYAKKRYGEDSVAQIATFGESKVKSAIRDVGRVLELPKLEVDRLARMVPEGPKVDFEGSLASVPELKAASENPRTKRLFDLALGLEGLYRQAGKHAAGIVIGDRPLIDLIPLMKVGAGEEAGVCTAFAMNECEDVGLVKMDILGLRTIDLIYGTLSLIQTSHGVRLEEDEIPVRDNHSMETTKGKHPCPVHKVPFGRCRCCDKTLDLYCKAEVNGVFQVEGSGMKKLLMNMRPDRFDDLIALVALYRPGPLGSGMHETYVRRKNGEEEVVYDHPCLEPILKDTYGQFIYQESVMRLAVALAGFTLPEADTLRKAMGKKKADVMEKLKDKFVGGCIKTVGLEQSKAIEIWGKIDYFSSYAFNKSHSAAYALISWHTAWLKANYPIEFMAALLTSWSGVTDRLATYVEEARRMGIHVEPPCINTSDALFSIRKDEGGTPYILYGLEAIKGVGPEKIEHILEARVRVGGRFRSITQFCEEIDSKTIPKGVLEAFAKAGAFRSLGVRRSQLFTPVERTVHMKRTMKTVVETPLETAARLSKAVKKDQLSGQSTLFSPTDEERFELDREFLPTVPEWDEHQILEAEKEALGYYLTRHPLDEHRERILEFATLEAARVGEVSNERRDVIIGGIVRSVRESLDKNQNLMAFASLEDLSGTIDGVCFSNVWAEYKSILTPGRVVFLQGELDSLRDPPSIRIKYVIPIEEAHKKLMGSTTVEILLFKGRVTNGELERASAIMRENPGPYPVFFQWAYQNEDRSLKKSGPVSVSGTAMLRQTLQDVFGTHGAVRPGRS